LVILLIPLHQHATRDNPPIVDGEKPSTVSAAKRVVVLVLAVLFKLFAVPFKISIPVHIVLIIVVAIVKKVGKRMACKQP
jgi:hypothetical protein